MKKKNDNIINNTSKEFPMKTFYGNISPQIQKPNKPIIKLFPDLRNGFNNESPDFFRMDSMKENELSYKNPYLNVVKTCDRSLFYKNNQNCIAHINQINKVKSKRELSQNPKIVRQLNYSTDINILENNLHKTKKCIPYLYKTLSSDFKNSDYLKKIKTLNGEYLPNNHYLTKNSFDMKLINENQIINSIQEIQDPINNSPKINNEKQMIENSLERKSPSSFRNTTFLFNKDNVNVEGIERGVENKNAIQTMYPSNNQNLCKFKKKFIYLNCFSQISRKHNGEKKPFFI